MRALKSDLVKRLQKDFKLRHVIRKLNMEAYQQRVVDELKDLNTKRISLEDFILTDKFDDSELEHRLLLIEQSRIMTSYAKVLYDRIERFKRTGSMPDAN